ncbi:MAG TPA: hypothetical protein VEI03_15605 [Stellaceae bacterium]|nr:hypothetical protein [Stellaceae bacterium]
MLAGILGVALLSRSSLGYNHDGHFYTIVAVEHDDDPPLSGLARDEAILIGFCGQVPDLADNLEAITLRVEEIPSLTGTLWGGFGLCWGDGVRRMATVHQFVHALTGSPAENVTAAAIDLIRTLRSGQEAAKLDPVRACAIGFALHLLGDSFAHRRLDKPDRTYPPGLGHFRDGHDPDYIELRSALWDRYTRTLAAALGISSDAAHWAALDRVAPDNAANGTEENGFNTKEIVDALTGLLGPDAPLWAGYSPPLEDLNNSDGLIASYVLEKSFDDIVAKYHRELQRYGTFTFDEVWALYLPAAMAAFRRHDVTTVCDPR